MCLNQWNTENADSLCRQMGFSGVLGLSEPTPAEDAVVQTTVKYRTLASCLGKYERGSLCDFSSCLPVFGAGYLDVLKLPHSGARKMKNRNSKISIQIWCTRNHFGAQAAFDYIFNWVLVSVDQLGPHDHVDKVASFAGKEKCLSDCEGHFWEIAPYFEPSPNGISFCYSNEDQLITCREKEDSDNETGKSTSERSDHTRVFHSKDWTGWKVKEKTKLVLWLHDLNCRCFKQPERKSQ